MFGLFSHQQLQLQNLSHCTHCFPMAHTASSDTRPTTESNIQRRNTQFLFIITGQSSSPTTIQPIATHPAQLNWQRVNGFNIAQAFLETTIASATLTVVRQHIQAKRSLTLATRKIATIIPLQAFHNIVSIFLISSVHLSGHMLIAYIDKPLFAIHERGCNNPKVPQRQTSED